MQSKFGATSNSKYSLHSVQVIITEEEEQVFKKLGDLNLDLRSDIPVVGKHFREIILRKTELDRSFFQRQHEDVEQLHASLRQFTENTKRVEKLTIAMIGLSDCSANSNGIPINIALELRNSIATSWVQ